MFCIVCSQIIPAADAVTVDEIMLCPECGCPLDDHECAYCHTEGDIKSVDGVLTCLDCLVEKELETAREDMYLAIAHSIKKHYPEMDDATLIDMIRDSDLAVQMLSNKGGNDE